MKFTLTFITLISVSTINVKATKEPNQFEHDIIDYSVNRIKSIEENIPDWDASASLEKNALTIVNKALQSGTIPFWNPGAALKVNLVYALEAFLRSLDIQDFDETKTFEENIDFAIVDFLRSLPMIPSWFPIDFIQKKMVNNVLAAFENIPFPGFDVNKSVDDDVVAWVEASIAEIDPSAELEDAVPTAVKNALHLLLLVPGFSPSKTLQENVSRVIEDLLLLE
ncbi:uncharacterized protein LOC128390346 [Panonychus citri]|uniref:uncharacterized protein LOC128390346 n=1 Tax=Panonychus citri TaxID=50023 RepID=UPI0023077297|nr:uncharacterized protein LOC128390346 [Panonychus citri]